MYANVPAESSKRKTKIRRTMYWNRKRKREFQISTLNRKSFLQQFHGEPGRSATLDWISQENSITVIVTIFVCAEVVSLPLRYQKLICSANKTKRKSKSPQVFYWNYISLLHFQKHAVWVGITGDWTDRRSPNIATGFMVTITFVICYSCTAATILKPCKQLWLPQKVFKIFSLPTKIKIAFLEKN